MATSRSKDVGAEYSFLIFIGTLSRIYIMLHCFRSFKSSYEEFFKGLVVWLVFKPQAEHVLSEIFENAGFVAAESVNCLIIFGFLDLLERTVLIGMLLHVDVKDGAFIQEVNHEV